MAPSWHHWTPLRRCGCRSGNMKKTEHMPSTGRPSSRGPCPAISPRTAIKLPPSCCRRLLHLSCSGYFCITRYHSPALLLLPEKCTRRCVVVSIFTTFLLYSPPLDPAPPAVGWQHPLDSKNKGASRVCERAAVSTVGSYCRPHYFHSVHIEVLVLLSRIQNSCKV